MAALDDLPWFTAPDRAAWRSWLEANHATSPGIWLVTYRKGSGQPVLAYDDLVREALAFGWVDSKPATVDDARTRILVTPRKKGSSWSRPNQLRVAELEAAGLMAPAGQRLVDQAKADGSWNRLDAVEDLVVPDDLAAAFDRHAGSRAFWDAFPKSVRRGILEWITTAKKSETRATRVEQTASMAANNERANQWRKPGQSA